MHTSSVPALSQTVAANRLLCALLLAATLTAPRLAAQTTFNYPNARVDVAPYKAVEDCIAATERVRDSVKHADTIFVDETPLSPDAVEDSSPALILETARRCGVKFDARQAPIDDWFAYMILFLQGNRTQDVDTLVARRLALADTKHGVKADSDRFGAIDTVVAQYMLAKPRRTDAISKLVRFELKRDRATPWQRIRLMVDDNFAQGGDACLHHAVPWGRDAFEVELKKLTDVDRRRTEYVGYMQTQARALDCSSEAALMDSLRRGSAGYIALRKANWTTATGERADAIPFPMGQRAPAIEGDFWYVPGSDSDHSAIARRSQPDHVRPALGQVSLLVFLDYECSQATRSRRTGVDRCWDTYAILRRLAKKFPRLEITLVARTTGTFWPLPPVEPSAEADLFREWWLGFQHLPGTLAVTETKFWRLPEPDSRRINREVPNQVNYSFGKTWQATNRSAYLIDRNGIIVSVFAPLERRSEPNAEQLIDILLNQQVAEK